MEKIQSILTSLFDKHRLVFWYDAKRELLNNFQSLDLPGVEKIQIVNNQFGIKHRLLREQSNQKFLLYFGGPQPAELNNWLLDVQLENATFNADQVSLWMAEIGIRPEFFSLVQESSEFFQSSERRTQLKRIYNIEDSHNQLRTRMLAVCVGLANNPRLESILEVLLDSLSDGSSEYFDIIERCNLCDFLWERTKVHYGYKPEHPSIKDFAFKLFRNGYQYEVGDSGELNQDAVVFLERWKDSNKFKSSFEKLSTQAEEVLDIGSDLKQRDMELLIDLDYFSLIEKKIIKDLINRVINRSIHLGEFEKVIWRRQKTHWYKDFQFIYEAILNAARFFDVLDKVDLHIISAQDGARKYCQTWYKIDQLYRRFILCYRKSSLPSLLKELYEMVENHYSSRFLMPVNDAWQQAINQLKNWEIQPLPLQSNFYTDQIAEVVQNGSKMAVVISDALRFEIGDELKELINQEDRYQGECNLMLAMLPSFTQLGMAALLPHQKIELLMNGSVNIDGSPTSGTENRQKILDKKLPGQAKALRSEDFLGLTHEESRALFRENTLVYIYHNQIDAIGDAAKTEEQVFDAVETAKEELLKIIKKLTAANYTNIIITADHGFIYQHQKIEEYDFAGTDVEAQEIGMKNRRFVIGKGIQPSNSIRIYRSADLKLDGELEVAIPNSINRLRLQGSGSRYVHGGSSLQEVLLPVLHINKSRVSDISLVDVDVISSGSKLITTGQISVAFFQEQPVSEKQQTRELRVGIYTAEGELISNQELLKFDFSSENARDREVQVRFILSQKAGKTQDQTIFLKLEEQEPGTTIFKTYKTIPYQLKISIDRDFDF